MSRPSVIRAIRAVDHRIAELTAGAAGLTRGFVIASDLATRGEMAIVAISLAAALARARPAEAGRLCLSLGLTLITVHLVGARYRRRRPFGRDEYARPASVDHDQDRSFPSRHAACAGAITFALHGRYRAVAGALSIVIAVCRVAAGLHFPSDVAAGWTMGAICARCATIVTRK